MSELSEGVRNRAAIVLHNALTPADTGVVTVQRRLSTEERYAAAVDAVFEVIGKDIVAERDQLRARVAELTEALTRIKNFGHGYSGCPGDRWCSVCTARAALTADAAPTEGGEQCG